MSELVSGVWIYTVSTGRKKSRCQQTPGSPRYSGAISVRLVGEVHNAVEEIFGDLQSIGNSVMGALRNAGGQTETFAKNSEAYLTPENMETAGVLAMAAPFLMFLFTEVGTLVLIVLQFLNPAAHSFLELMLKLLSGFFVILTAAGTAGIGYLIWKNPQKRTFSAVISLIMAAASLVLCILRITSEEAYPFWLTLIPLLWGVDAFSRAVLQKNGIESDVRPGTDLVCYKNWYDVRRKELKEERIRREQSPTRSYFDGTGGQLFAQLLLTFFAGFITLGLAVPWMVCRIIRWKKSHTVIGGRRLAFTGTSGSLFGHAAVWGLLTVVTCGMYSFFLYAAFRRWELSHTVYADAMNEPGAFDGTSFQYCGYKLLNSAILVVTSQLAFPWTATLLKKWEFRHCMIGRDRLVYRGTGLGILREYLVITFFSLITCGIYYSWGVVRLNKYIYEFTETESLKGALALPAPDESPEEE